ncbi:hypothetical protein ANN_15450 [Periplaneta americana]|uniref:Uncharacterized protein n=1 Tax=Periplaneta americana TaxID=6978 RepID=A0ABQ8SGU8_PERAM|nr:hypothetical protein ANN_15450 [Periplaneta americana]
MSGLCKGGNGAPGSLKASKSYLKRRTLEFTSLYTLKSIPLFPERSFFFSSPDISYFLLQVDLLHPSGLSSFLLQILKKRNPEAAATYEQNAQCRKCGRDENGDESCYPEIKYRSEVTYVLQISALCHLEMPNDSVELYGNKSDTPDNFISK